jgi:UDP-N-acetyl-D-glucosamine dehydrogenase
MANKTVCILGLGFVGSAMAVACAKASHHDTELPIYDVIGLDLPTDIGLSRVNAINKGNFPFETTDAALPREAYKANLAGNLKASTNLNVLSAADIVVVDIHLDISDLGGPIQEIQIQPFEGAIRSIGERIAPGTLVIIETTVPPGTCSNVVRPILDECAIKRGYKVGDFLLAHAYERVMPGSNYLESIINYWRVFSADSPEAADQCEFFLKNIVNTKEYPLTRLSSMIASESAKLLENSYRAVNIAFIDEWSVYAEHAGFDLFEVIKAIRMRPTHSNIRQPGFGVGGYCLTKDPLFAELACKTMLGLSEINFPMTRMAVKINQEMPLWAISKLRKALGGLKGKSILLVGVTYREDVADTRYSPSEIFYNAAVAEGASLDCYDPLIDYWEDIGVFVKRDLGACPNVDAVVFAVSHEQFKYIVPSEWINGVTRPYILDANNCLSHLQRVSFIEMGCSLESIGCG